MINYKVIAIFLGTFLMALGLCMCVPALIDLYYDSLDWLVFLKSGTLTFFVGLALYFPFRMPVSDLSLRESFLLTFLAWILLGLFASIPFLVSHVALNPVDAFFEAVSGWTTTGSTVFTRLEELPRGILFWRAFLQWLGGIGIIVIAIALTPMRGIGGMYLFHAESSDKSDKMIPRIKKLAGAILVVYFGLTVLCALAYSFCGMSVFDAATHAMTTLSTGGFSNYDSSMGHFQNPWIEWTAVLFMVAGSLPFVLYVQVMRGQGGFAGLFGDDQVKFLLRFLGMTVLLLGAWLWVRETRPLMEVIRQVAFHVTSIVTTTGFTMSDYSLGGPLVFEMFFFLLFVGGCSGSTTGGIKMFRFILIWELIKNRVNVLISPSLVAKIKINNNVIGEDETIFIVTFIPFYILFVCGLALMLSLQGLDFITSFSGAATAVSNVGPGLGESIGPLTNFSGLNDFSKLCLAFGMIAGRLEFFAILVCFNPRFWKR